MQATTVGWLGARRWAARGMLAAGAVAVALLSTGHPAAAATAPQVTSGPAGATTATALVWKFSDGGGSTSCELSRGATVVAALADCSSPATYDVSSQPGGHYTFIVWGAAAAAVDRQATPSDSSTVDVAPTAPKLTGSPTSPGHDPSPSWSFTLPTGATGTCELDQGGGAVAVVSPCSSPFTADLSHDQDATYDLVLTATAGGVSSATTTSSYTLRTAPPANPSVTPPASPSRDTSPTFQISDPDAVTLTCKLTDPTGAVVASGACPADGTFRTVGYADGTYTLRVTATDAAGNTADTVATWRRDTVAPPAPSVTAHGSPGKTRSPDFPVSDTEAGVAFQCRVSGPTEVPVNCGPDAVVDLSGAADGTYTLRVAAVDAAGNVSPATAVTYTLMTVPPPAPDVLAPPSPGNTTNPTFVVSDDQGGVTYQCSATGPNGQPVQITTCDASGAVLNLSSVANGAVTVTVVAVDAVGNVSDPTTVTWVLDTQKPAPPQDDPPTTLPDADLTPTFRISDSENDVTLTCVLTAPTGKRVFAGLCPDPATFDTTGFTDGVYTLVVTATDPAGNVSRSTATWTRDRTAPDAPAVTGVPTGASDDTSPAVSISDDSPDTAGYRCALTGPDGTIPVTVCGPNATLDLTGTPDGLITLTVSAVDAAGNVSASTTKTWTLDTTAPAAPRVKGVTLGNSRTVSVKLRESESDVSYTCTPTGAQPVTVDTCGPTTTFTIGGGSADGVFRLVVAATDAAGNTSRTTTFAYRLDTTPPPSPLVRRRPASLTNDASPRMRISDQEAGVTLSCRLDGPGGQVWSGDCPPDGTVPTEGAGDGAYAFTVTATDPAGNAAHTTVRWTLDTTPPAAPQVRRVAGSGSSGNATTVSFAVTASDSADTLSCVATDPQGRPVPVSVSLSGGTGTCAMDLTGETAQGRYTLRVTETDAAGNASSDTGTYDYDTLPPALPRLTLGQASVGRSRTPDWQIHAGSGDRTFRCVLTDDSSGAILTQGACSAQFSPAQPLPGRSGRFTLAVVAADAAGNLTSPVTSTYRLDRVPPAAPAATISGSPDHVTSSGLVVSSDPRPSVSIHQLTGLHYTCEVSAPGGGFVPVSSCAQPLAGVSVTTPTDTLYVVRVIAVDAAGNQRFTDLRYELLTIPPAAPIITQHPSGDTPLRRSSFAWTTAHGDTSICTIVHGTAQQPGQVVVGPVIGCHPGWTVSLPKGTYTFEVRLDDGVGNVSAPATATFTVDPSATLPPVIHGPKSPGRVTHPHFTVKAPPGTTRLSCLLTENGRVIYRGDCPPNNRFDLSKRPDGVFVLTVVAHLPNGVTSSSSIGYILDRRPPARPTLVSRPHATGHGGKVDWNFLLPAGTSGECTLLLDGRPVVGPVTCRDMASYALSRLHGDGRFTFKVVAIDAAGNHSSPLEVAYDGSAVGQVAAVSMPSPSVRLLTHANGRTTWAINDSVGSRFFCRVTHNGVVVVGERSCSSEFTTDLAGQPAGEYLLHVFAVSRVGGIVSPTSTAAFSWAGVPSGQTQSAPVPTRPQHRPSKPAPVNRAPAHPIVTTPNRGGPARPQPSPPKQPAKHPGPSPVPSKLVPGVSRQIADGVQSVVSNIGSAGGGAGFPLLLVLGVGLFLLVQNRIDRQDPKLALAAVGDDDFVEFILPPSHDGDREQW